VKLVSTRLGVCIASAAVVGFIISATAYAAEPRDKDPTALRELFKRATTHFNLGKFKEAAIEYEQLYEAHPDPVLLYNIAQSYRLAGESERALFFYRSYLRNNPQAKNRAEVDARIVDLEHLVSEQKKTQTRPPNSPVPLDKRGGTTTEAEPQTTTPTEGTASTSTGETATAQTSTSTSDRRDRPVYKKWWFWTIIGGAVVVAVAVGVGVGVGTSGGSDFNPNFPTTGPGAAAVGPSLGVRF
jgi:tetratricopeptide (TPR) repeat protein